jgi:cell division GTPase FtsZ
VDDIGDSQKVKEISQATAEQMSRQGNDLSQSHSVCVVVFGNHETLKEQLLDEVAMEIYGRGEEDKRGIHKGVIDDTMKDGELLVVTLALASEIKKSYRVYVRETDDDKYQKRFEEMRSMFTAPGLVALTDKKVNWFSELGGFAFIGEAEAAGDNAAMNATASLMSSWMLSTRNYWQLETGDFKDTASFLVHILGSSKVVDMRTEGDVKSVIRETSTGSTCTIGVHLDDNMGEKVRITLVSLITY